MNSDDSSEDPTCRECGRLGMTLRAPDTLEVWRWILEFGSVADALEPVALRETLRQYAETLARTLTPRQLPPTTIPLSESGAMLGRAARPRT